MDNQLVIFAKISCILALSWTLHFNFTAPHQANKTEKFKEGRWDEKLHKIYVDHPDLTKAIFHAIGVAEIIDIIRSDPPTVHINGLSLAAISLALLGTLLRKACYVIMAENFTFEVSLRDNHRLITQGPYGVVRHPSYTGMILVYAGIFLWHSAPGSWMRVSGVMEVLPIAAFIGAYATFMVGILAVLLFRIPREDRLMKKHFGKQWDEWAQKVPYILIPYLV